MVAENFVGQGPASSVTSFYTCNDPTNVTVPVLSGQVTSTKVPIAWGVPGDAGGCAITSYSILRDGGPSNQTFIEVHAAAVNNNPTIRNFIVTDLPANIVGQPVRFKI